MKKVLPSVSYTGRRGDVPWRMVGASGRWRASIWCDCILGPHFHDLGLFKTARQAQEAIDRQVLEKVEA